MPKSLQTPDRLFDRTWRPGHPFRPRVSGLRRVAMMTAFLVLTLVIGAYVYITEPTRVGRMAETYLTELLGGPVRVGQATLSIFEGLRLDDVRLYSDSNESTGTPLFSAKSFVIQYSSRALLSGHIEATSILAIEPHVHVTEDADTGVRNYSHLLESRASGSIPTAPSGAALILPEIILRNAQVEYTRLRAGQPIESSSIAIEGQLKPPPPDDTNIYTFAFQSRGRTAGIGPMIQGQIDMGTGKITASLQNFEFGADVKTMLPKEVRKWWEEHELTGRVGVPLVTYIPPSEPGGKAGYRVEIELRGVTLAVHPEEWMGEEEIGTLQDLHEAFNTLRSVGMNGHGFINQLAELVEPGPVYMKQVHGRFIFTDDEAIQIDDLNGWLEEVPFKISGRIKGYNASAQAQIRIASSDLHDIEIPAAPRYLNSLPPGVREIYDRFRPRGICRFWIDLNRLNPGERPHITGQVDIVDANFSFERFPYPLRKTTGHIILSQDPATGEDRLQLDHIRGRGIEGGPNANSIVEVNGVIGPFGPDAAVNIVVSGQHVSSEPQIMAAFPPLTRKAMAIFDAPGKGEFPKFTGDFACSIIRLRGIEPHWIINTGIHLDDASGSLQAFPYPMTGVSGELKVHDDGLELSNIVMKKGDATLQIDGRVSWGSSDDNAPPPPPGDGPALKPNLRLVAKDVPINEDLLNALPPARRAWLEKVGARGKFDLEGTIKPATTAGDDLDFDLRLAVRDGALWPIDGKPAVTNVEGNLRLTNQRLTISNMQGRRGDAEVSARGEVSWPTEPPRIVLRAEAKDLALDSILYRLIPESAQSAWTDVHPDGTVDVALNYSGAATETTQPASPAGYEILITPKKLSATPSAVPYRLDDLSGSLSITPTRVVLKDMTARHGEARVRFAGSSAMGQQTGWDFGLAGENVAIDEDLRKAVPQSMADLLQSIQMTGKLNFEFSKLHVAPNKPATAGAPVPPPDVDFAVKLATAGSSVNVGVALSDVKAAADLTGSSRNGRLNVLTGKLDADSFTLAGRPVTRFHADVNKPAGQDQLTFSRIEAALARGSMVGQIDFRFADKAPTRYALNFTLRNADVRDLAGETEPDIHGLLSADLALEGTNDQPNSRRGRGFVEINGDHMYRIPLILGLLQITNLSLPITSPFTQGLAKYSVDGSKVTFDQIEMRSKEMVMQGDGQMDFNTKEVHMKFVTDAVTWIKLPFIGDLLESARHELLQIQVRGTIQEPKVSARSMNTITTTVDQVFRGDERTASNR